MLFIYLIAILVTIGFIIYKDRNLTIPEQILPLLKTATLVYNGEKEPGYFASYKHKIRAKPDFIYQHDDGTYSVVIYCYDKVAR